MNVQVFDQILQEDYFSSSSNGGGQGHGRLVGGIDQGTSSTRFLVFTEKGRIAASAQTEHRQIYNESQAGWHEHDPLELFDKTFACIQAVGDALLRHGTGSIDLRCPITTTATTPTTSSSSSTSSTEVAGTTATTRTLAAIGITNQRETTIAWNRKTGIPYYNAIVWDDTRTQGLAEQLAQGNPNRFRKQTGLPLVAYFAGTKVKWLLDNVPALSRDLQDPVERENVCFGTVDCWLAFQLTGIPAENQEKARNCQGQFRTDVTNASRWLFMDLPTAQWSDYLVQTICAPHELPLSCLPEICPSGYHFGVCSGGGVYVQDVPIAAILGDQHAALFGQMAFRPGEAKNTYGTGLFLMMNTGDQVFTSERLLTTIAYQLPGKDQPVVYALEGSVSHSGSTIQWLRDQLQIIPSAHDSEALATVRNDGLYFVPAFAGLFAPHWRSDARACLVGLTTHHHKGHVCRAALEAAAYQTKEVFDAIESDSHIQLKSLKVDGGGTANHLLMQFQADMLQVPVVKPVIKETTCLGVAYCAGLTVGVWKDLEEIESLAQVALPSSHFIPIMSKADRDANWMGWKKAVSRSMGWIDGDDTLTKPPSPPPSQPTQATRDNQKAKVGMGTPLPWTTTIHTGYQYLSKYGAAVVGSSVMGLGVGAFLMLLSERKGRMVVV